MRRVTVDRISAEELVHTSEEVALSRSFDARNTVWLRGLIAILAFVVIGEAMFAASSRKIGWPRPLPFLNLLLILVALGVLDELGAKKRRIARIFRPLAAIVGRNLRAWTLGFLAVEYLLLLLFGRGGGWVGIFLLSPFAMLALRLLPVEVLLMHGFFVVAAAVEGIVMLKPKHGSDLAGVLFFGVLLNVSTMTFELVSTRRFRKAFLSRYREDRRDALERQRMRDELRFAREVQISMLPAAPPLVPWLDIAASSLPATEVGGDYYDFFALDADHIAIVSGDVAGHGLASGLVLAALRTGFTLLRDQLGDPARVLRRLHDLIIETSRRRMLVTAAIVLLDRTRGRAVVTSAGHPPLIVKRSGAAAVAIELFAPPLGVRLPVETPERALSFATGDCFVLQSDGIYETLNAIGETYGLERVAEVVDAQPPTATAAEIRDAILADVEHFRGLVAQADDVTLVVARVTTSAS